MRCVGRLCGATMLHLEACGGDMFGPCVMCGRWTGGNASTPCPGLACVSCVEDLARCRHEGGARVGEMDVVALYDYRPAIRDLIWRAKVYGQPRVVMTLAAMFAGEDRVRDAATRCDAIMPAPSSFWGRVRGRYDLADALARELGRVCDRPVIDAPSGLHWRRFKRAIARGAADEPSRRQFERWAEAAGMWTPPGGVKSVLLVDDVVTSGQTITRLIEAVVGVQVEAATFAVGRSRVREAGRT